jgi:hypothetical protein
LNISQKDQKCVGILENTVLEKDRENELDRWCEKLRSFKISPREQEYRTHYKTNEGYRQYSNVA